MTKTGIIATVIIVLVIIVGIGAYAFNSNSNTPAPVTTEVQQPTDSPQDVTQSTATSTMTATSTEKDFTVDGKNFSFTPNALTVNRGDTVKITFKNDSGVHNFKIDEFNVATDVIPTGQSQTVTFVADKVGTFEYYCSVGEHRAMGMYGKLTVN